MSTGEPGMMTRAWFQSQEPGVQFHTAACIGVAFTNTASRIYEGEVNQAELVKRFGVEQ